MSRFPLKFASLMALVIILANISSTSSKVQGIEASGTIYIRADGSVDPSTVPISSFDNVTYTLTGNITSDSSGLKIERSNMTLDGAGYTLQGPGNGTGTGVDISHVNKITVRNMVIESFRLGIFLNHSVSDNIYGNNIRNNSGFLLFRPPEHDGTDWEYAGTGILIQSSRNTNINGNNITNNLDGVGVRSSSDNIVSGNNVTANRSYGIYLTNSTDNIVLENNVANNLNTGIDIDDSSGCVLRDNTIVGSRYNFGIGGYSLSGFVNDVDVSNTVDGKPVYCWVSEHDRRVPLDAGYVALVNCSGITVQNLNLSKNWQGVVLAYTTNSTITQNKMANNGDGIDLFSCTSNDISGNNITANSRDGIWLNNSSNNSVSENNMANNFDGIELDYSSSNTITGNNVTANDGYGIGLFFSPHNKFHHNDIMNNYQVFSLDSTSAWDDGYPSGGNYWSDYNGTDLYSGSHQNETGYDWIGDSPYIIDQNNTDRYPLMHAFSPGTEEIRIAYRSLLLRHNEMRSELQESIGNLTVAFNSTRDSLQGQINSLSQAFESLNQSTTSLQEQYNSLRYQLSTILSIFGAVIVVLFATTAYLATRKPKTKLETQEENQA